MKFLFDLFPIILFVVTYVLTDDIYLATAVIIPATILQVAYARIRYGKVDKMLWASLVLILVMGSLTLLLHDKRFIMWKPTLLYWVFATALALAPVLAKCHGYRTRLSARRGNGAGVPRARARRGDRGDPGRGPRPVPARPSCLPACGAGVHRPARAGVVAAAVSGPR
jgi:hypothetical protein